MPFTVEAIEQNINDIAGVRVICSFPSDIYELAEAFLRQDDITLIQKEGLYKKSQEKRLSQPAPYCGNPDFLHNQKKTHEGGGSVPHNIHGLVGFSRA